MGRCCWGTTEVSHAEDLRGSAHGGGAEEVLGGGLEVVGRQPEGAAGPGSCCRRTRTGRVGRTGKSRRPTRAAGRRWRTSGVASCWKDSRRLWSAKRRATPPVAKRLDGEQEAQVIALRLGPPPPGYAHWSLRLLARRVVELEIVESVSHETVRRTLKKTASPDARSRTG